MNETSEVGSRESVDVLRRDDSVTNDIFLKVRGKRELDDDAVYFRILIQLIDFLKLEIRNPSSDFGSVLVIMFSGLTA